MGCNSSVNGIVIDQDKELKEYLKPYDIRLVQESWNLLQDDLEHVGLIMFHRLFLQQGHLKKLFSKLMTREFSGELVIDDEKLKAHGKIVMDALGAAVECLDDSAQLTSLLISVGERHALYGVQADMVPHLWPAIVAALEEKLGSNFTSDVGQAWEHVFSYLASKVMEGISKWSEPISDR